MAPERTMRAFSPLVSALDDVAELDDAAMRALALPNMAVDSAARGTWLKPHSRVVEG